MCSQVKGAGLAENKNTPVSVSGPLANMFTSDRSLTKSLASAASATAVDEQHIVENRKPEVLATRETAPAAATRDSAASDQHSILQEAHDRHLKHELRVRGERRHARSPF